MRNFTIEFEESKFNSGNNDSKLQPIDVTLDDVLFYCDQAIKPIIQVNRNNCNIINGNQAWLGHGETLKVKGQIVQKHSIVELDRAANYMETIHLNVMERA